MALEAEAADISMSEVLGCPPKEFCDEIISSAGRLSYTENILQWITTLLQGEGISIVDVGAQTYSGTP